MVARSSQLSQQFNNLKKNITTMKNYLRPEIDILTIVAERGYGDSIGLPAFGTEQDELVY